MYTFKKHAQKQTLKIKSISIKSAYLKLSQDRFVTYFEH